LLLVKALPLPLVYTALHGSLRWILPFRCLRTPGLSTTCSPSRYAGYTGVTILDFGKFWQHPSPSGFSRCQKALRQSSPGCSVYCTCLTLADLYSRIFHAHELGLPMSRASRGFYLLLPWIRAFGLCQLRLYPTVPPTRVSRLDSQRCCSPLLG